MKLLKNITFVLFIVTSSVVFAGVGEIIDLVSEKVTEASKAIDNGSSKEDVILLIRTAAKVVKEIPQGDNIDIKRQRANGHLKQARFAAQKGNLDVAKQHLAEASKGFADLRSQF